MSGTMPLSFTKATSYGDVICVENSTSPPTSWTLKHKINKTVIPHVTKHCHRHPLRRCSPPGMSYQPHIHIATFNSVPWSDSSYFVSQWICIIISVSRITCLQKCVCLCFLLNRGTLGFYGNHLSLWWNFRLTVDFPMTTCRQVTTSLGVTRTPEPQTCPLSTKHTVGYGTAFE